MAWVEHLMQVRQGRAEALAALYDEASPLVFSVALRIVENRADAEEVTVDVFTQVWRNAGQWNADRGAVTSWLMLLTRSRALDKLRWRKARTRLEDSGLAREFASPSESLDALERKERVQSAMQALSEAQQVVVDLAFFGGLTHQEIAEMLNEPLGTVKSRIRTAMLKMKEVLSA